MDNTKTNSSSGPVIRILKALTALILILVVLYGVLLAWVTPIVAKNIASNSVEEYTYWNLLLNDIVIKPFDLAIEINQLHLLSPDNEREAGFANLFVDIAVQDTLNNLIFEGNLKPVVQDIRLAGFYSNIELDTEGNPEIVKRIKSQGPDKEDPNQAPPSNEDSEGIKWLIKQIALQQASIRFKDNQLKSPFVATLEEIDFSLQDLSDELDQRSPYSLTLRINGAKTSLTGDIAPLPLDTSGQFKLSNFDLTHIQPFISEQTLISLKSGDLSIASDFNVQQDDELSGEVTLDVQIGNLDVAREGEDKSFASFDQLQIKPVSIKLSPLSVNVSSIDLLKPFTDIKRDKDGQINLATLLIEDPKTTDINNAAKEPSDTQEQDSASATAAPRKQDQSEPHTSEAGLIFALGPVNIKDGTFSFSDASTSPAFATQLEQFNLSLSGFKESEPSELVLDTKLLSNGALKIDALVNNLTTKPDGTFKASLKHIPLANVSAYTSHYVGYPIDNGSLNFDLDYQITQDELDAKHGIFIDHLEFGKQSNESPLVTAPLPMVVGILEDSNSLIELHVPVKGNLSDPSVNIQQLIFDAFKGLFTKIITSPFSILGNILGIEENISAASFEQGKWKLNGEQTRRVQKLGQVLKQRPKLSLGIQCYAHEQLDQNALIAAKSTDLSLEMLATNRTIEISKYLKEIALLPESRIDILSPVVGSESSIIDGERIVCEFNLK